jgi:hypothetical protein
MAAYPHYPPSPTHPPGWTPPPPAPPPSRPLAPPTHHPGAPTPPALSATDASYMDSHITHALLRLQEVQKMAKQYNIAVDPVQLALLVGLQALTGAVLEVALALHMDAGRTTGEYALQALVPPDLRP